MAKSSNKATKEAPADRRPNVDHVLKAVEDAMPAWKKVRDCLDGEDTIKAAGVTYLPMPNPGDKSTENVARYDAYKLRGLYVNFVGRTVNGMVGTAFSREPVATLPEALMMLHENVDGGAVSMDQQARQVLSDALSVGRCGLLTDYPAAPVDANGKVIAATREQMNKGEVRPVIQFYFAEDIINWRYTVVNSLRKLSLCVLRESYTIEEDEFKHDKELQWRVLRLVDGAVTVETYQKVNNIPVSQGPPVFVLKADGRPFDYIPFEFVGARNNDGGIDEVPMKGLADINVAHYRNSCDFEEMVFVLGQPTTVIAGLTDTWVKEVLKGEVVLGSTTALMLPEGATASYLQVNESQLSLEAMKHKEELAISIGAKMVNQATVQRTAKEAGMNDASEQSVLMSAVMNVNAAYKRSLMSAALFHGAPVTDDIGYELNTDFEIMQLDQAALAARVKMWTDGAITWTECRSILRRAGIATLTDEKAKAELDKEAAENNAAMGLEPDSITPIPGGPADPNADGGDNEEV